MICFLGGSHAAQHLREAAYRKGLKITPYPEEADLVFVSEDTPTDEKGRRDLQPIRELMWQAAATKKPIVLTSQVPPGFTRSFNLQRLYHQAETLRIKDAMERALAPEYIAVGCAAICSYSLLPEIYRMYLEAFDCPVRVMTYEDAEFSKIAVNMLLAAQVDQTNRLAEAAMRSGATWRIVADAISLDSRIGPHAYLKPGRWEDSPHLYRDFVTLEEILGRKDEPRWIPHRGSLAL